ncbi:transferase [Mycobacterium tuberculosis]|nr:transferase [Mycobacterium tuberculosis]
MVLCLFGGTSSVSTVTGAAGIGLATLAADGSVLDTWFPAPELTESGTSATSRLAVSDVPVELTALIGRDDDRRTETIAVRTVIGSGHQRDVTTGGVRRSCRADRADRPR